jgi:Fungal specific transcription factor domain
LKDHTETLESILDTIRDANTDDVNNIVQRIRSKVDYGQIAELSKITALPEISSGSSLENEFSNIMGGTENPGHNDEARHFGHTSNHGFLSTEVESVCTAKPENEPWTNVTSDAGLIEHLMTLYFTWQHPIYLLFSKECFLHDMAHSRKKYCSSLLVNTILAAACLFSDRPESRKDPSDSRTAGEHFYEEAKRLWAENRSSSLAAVQALAILSIREVSMGRESKGWLHMGASMRMALELGLHLSMKGSSAKMSSAELEVRRITFWGCFSLDQ